MAEVHVALAAVMRDVDHVAKRDRNEHQRFLFRGIDAVVNAVGPALRAHGVMVVPEVETVSYDIVATSSNKPATACRVVVTYRFFAEDGSELSTRVAAEAWDMGDKAAPKAMSVAFRTALLQALTLPTDEPDPDTSSYERGSGGPGSSAGTAAPSTAPVHRPPAVQRRRPPRSVVTTELATPEHPAPDGSVDVPMPGTEVAVAPPTNPPSPSERAAIDQQAREAKAGEQARRALFTVLGKVLGPAADRAHRLAVCAAILGRDQLESSLDMSDVEVSRVLTFLERARLGEAGWTYDAATGRATVWRNPPPEPPPEP